MSKAIQAVEKMLGKVFKYGPHAKKYKKQKVGRPRKVRESKI